MNSIPFLAGFVFLQIFIFTVEAQNSVAAGTKVTLVRESRFNSPEAFIAALKAFQPLQSSGYIGYEFAAIERGQPEDENTGRMVRASKIDSCIKLWSNDTFAVVFATATPPTEATRATAGVLFLLWHTDDTKWRIADLKKFTAYGKYNSIEAKLTSDAEGGGAKLQSEDIVVTVTKSESGQHLGSSISGSFRIFNHSWAPADLE